MGGITLMANKNDFKAFALAPNANVLSQASWEALPALLAGFSSGKASSAQVNKAIRQATTIAALVGQFIANSGLDALDNADVNGLVTKFTNALTTNLYLKTAAKRDVGTGVNQIPDMSSFAGVFATSGYQKLPGGLIIQWGWASTSTAGTTHNYPIAFPNSAFVVLSSDSWVSSLEYIATQTLSNSQFMAKGSNVTPGFSFLAIGN